MKLLNTVTGQIEDVQESEIADAVKSGNYALQKNTPVPVVSPDGTPGTVDSSEAAKAFGANFQYDTPDMQKKRADAEKFGNRPFASALAGMASSASLGASDSAMVHSGLVSPDTLSGLAEQNPTSHAVGEGLGILGPALLSGGESLALDATAGAEAVAKTSATKSIASKVIQTISAPSRLAAEMGQATEGLTSAALKKTLLAQGEQSLAKRVVTTALSKGAGSAVEGAFYGAGNLISEEALGHEDINAESLMAYIGGGAMIGGLAGSILGLGEMGLKGGTDLVKKSSRTLFQRLIGAEDAAEEGTVVAGLTGKKKNLADVRQAANELEVKLTTGAESNNNITRTAESILNETPTIWGEQVKRAHEEVRSGIQRNAEKVLEKAGTATEEEVGKNVIDNVTQKIKSLYDPFKKAYEEIRLHRPMVALEDSMLEKTSQRIQGLKIGSKGGDVEKYVQTKGGQILQQKSVDDLAAFISETKSDGRAFSRQGQDSMAFAAREVARHAERLHDRSIMRTAIDMAKSGVPGAEEAAKQLINGIREVNKNYAGFKKFMSDLGANAKLGKGTGFRQIIDKLESSDPIAIVKKLYNPKSPKSVEFMTKHFPEEFEQMRKLHLAKVAAAVTKEDAVHGTSIDINKLTREYYKTPEHFRGTLFGTDGARTIENIEKVHAAMPGLSNPSRTDIRHDFTRILTPVLNLRDMAMAGLLKMADRGPTKEALTVKGVDSLARIEKGQKTIVKTIKSSVDEFLTNAASAGEKVKKVTDRIPAVTTNALLDVSLSNKKPKKDETLHAAFERHQDDLAKLTANPGILAQRMANDTAALQLVAPKTAQSLQMKATKAIMFLDSKIPINPAPSRGPNLMIRKWKPSSLEMRKFERYMRAVDNPMHVIHDFRKGAMNREGVEVLRNVYPEIYTQLVGHITERMADGKTNLTYKKRLQLGTLLDTPIDLAQEPQFLMPLQAAYQQDQQDPQTRSWWIS
jgi:hypothetical protein